MYVCMYVCKRQQSFASPQMLSPIRRRVYVEKGINYIPWFGGCEILL